MIRQRTWAVAAVTGLMCLMLPARAGADDGIPFKDANTQGTITFCDQSGKAVTSGPVDVAPFVWTAVSSFATPAGYTGKGKTAALAGFQPRQGVDPGDWSGQALTTTSTYTDTSHPSVALTPADDGLFQYLSTYPPQWDNLMQVRMQLFATDLPGYGGAYASVVLRISPDGKTWTALNPGTTPCSSTTAVSTEIAAGLPKANLTSAVPVVTAAPNAATPSGHASGAAPSASTSSQGSGASAAGPSSSSSQHSSAPADSIAPTSAPSDIAARSTSSGGSGSSTGIAVVLVIAVIAVGGGAALWFRRRGSSTT